MAEEFVSPGRGIISAANLGLKQKLGALASQGGVPPDFSGSGDIEYSPCWEHNPSGL